MDVEDSNQLLDNVSGTLCDYIQSMGGHVDGVHVRFIMKQGILLQHVNLTIQKLLEKNIVHTCLHNLDCTHDHVHHHPDFLRELSDDLDSTDSESIYIQYAILVKKYNRICLFHEKQLYTLLNAIAVCTLEDMSEVIRIATVKIKQYRELKKNVCSSLFRVFEYIIEFEQLQSIMDPPSPPSSDPLLEQEEDHSGL
jgi:hypothetical protein